MLVKGVRSSWEASATNSRCRLMVLSVFVRAASSSRSISSSVRASSATSSSLSGSGIRFEGSRVVAISLAAAVRAEIGRMARLATAIPAIPDRIVPIATPMARKSHSLPIVASTDDSGRAYWR